MISELLELASELLEEQLLWAWITIGTGIALLGLTVLHWLVGE